MYDYPTLILALVARDTAADAATLTSVDKIEEVAGQFFFAVFDDSLNADGSIYIASLKATEVDQGTLMPNVGDSTAVRTLQPAEAPQVRYFQMKLSIFVRDGLLPKSQIETFISRTMSEAFRSTEVLLSLARGLFGWIEKIELTYKMEICPSGNVRCQHGSACTTSVDGDDMCDCSTSMFTVDGMQCEYIATDLCTTSTDSTKTNSSSSLSFCVNGGTCREKSISVEEQPHTACHCPSEYEGSRCERKKEGPNSEFQAEPTPIQMKNRDTPDESQIVAGLSNTLFWLIVGVGGAVILLAALIVGYKINRGRKARDEPSDLEDVPACRRRDGVDGTGRTAASSEERDTFEENASPLY